MAQTCFTYGSTETDYLSRCDKRLARVIERVGHIDRACHEDLFESLVNSIIGQQISTKAHQTIWAKLKRDLGHVDADALLELGPERLQAYGTTWRKVDYIMDLATKVETGEFDPESIATMDDANAITTLSSLRGVGVWTAEMMLLFCLQRPDILSYGDLAILRGMRMVYRHRELGRERFERYRRRFSPYGSTAALYFWAVAGGAIPELTDPAAPKTAKAGSPAKSKSSRKKQRS